MYRCLLVCAILGLLPIPARAGPISLSAIFDLGGPGVVIADPRVNKIVPLTGMVGATFDGTIYDIHIGFAGDKFLRVFTAGVVPIFLLEAFSLTPMPTGFAEGSGGSIIDALGQSIDMPFGSSPWSSLVDPTDNGILAGIVPSLSPALTTPYDIYGADFHLIMPTVPGASIAFARLQLAAQARAGSVDHYFWGVGPDVGMPADITTVPDVTSAVFLFGIALVGLRACGKWRD